MRKPPPPAPPVPRPSGASTPTATTLTTHEPETLIDSVTNAPEPEKRTVFPYVDAVVDDPAAKDDDDARPLSTPPKQEPSAASLPQAALPTSAHIDDFGFDELGASDDEERTDRL